MPKKVTDRMIRHFQSAAESQKYQAYPKHAEILLAHKEKAQEIMKRYQEIMQPAWDLEKECKKRAENDPELLRLIEEAEEISKKIPRNI